MTWDNINHFILVITIACEFCQKNLDNITIYIYDFLLFLNACNSGSSDHFFGSPDICAKQFKYYNGITTTPRDVIRHFEAVFAENLGFFEAYKHAYEHASVQIVGIIE